MSTARGLLKSIAYTTTRSRPRDRHQFLIEIADRARVLDVGCGNDSPFRFKTVRPDIQYVGLDVGDYEQHHDPAKYADEYVVVSSDRFLQAIQELSGDFDAVISCHNLEHCEDPDGVVVAMARALRPAGRIFLSFPAAASVKFPSREGTLNFFDDVTHVRPPDYSRVLGLLRAEGVTVSYAVERHRPRLEVARGIVNEPVSRLRNKVMRGTWALYGFESVIWGRKSL